MRKATLIQQKLKNNRIELGFSYLEKALKKAGYTVETL